MESLRHAPDRIQQHFNDLLMNTDDGELHQYDQLYTSFSGSSGSLSSDATNGSISALSNSVSGSVAESITTILSSAMANTLALSSHTNVHALDSDHHRRTRRGRVWSDGMHEGCRMFQSNISNSSNPSFHAHVEPVDFGWLRERCEGDNRLVQEVLRTFCEQGQRHISGMQSSIKDMDAKMLLFHAVNHQNAFQTRNNFLHISE